MLDTSTLLCNCCVRKSCANNISLREILGASSSVLLCWQRNDPYTHFSQQPHNKLMWLVIFYEKWFLHSFFTTASQQADVAGNILLLFYKKKTKQNKNKIKYYKPHQLVVGLWEMSVGIISHILLFFYKNKTKQNKKNNKILPATSACCGAVVRNECKDHFSCWHATLFSIKIGWHVSIEGSQNDTRRSSSISHYINNRILSFFFY
jgi:hypothetical protein